MKMEDRLSDTDDYRRDHFVRIIERAVEKMTLKELEAVANPIMSQFYQNAQGSGAGSADEAGDDDDEL